MKAFMDDVTVILESKSNMDKLLKRLQELFNWAVMKIKPLKAAVYFAINNNVIPTICKKKR